MESGALRMAIVVIIVVLLICFFAARRWPAGPGAAFTPGSDLKEMDSLIAQINSAR